MKNHNSTSSHSPSRMSVSELCKGIIKLEDNDDEYKCMKSDVTLESLEENNGCKIKTESIYIKSEYGESDTISNNSLTLLMLIHEEHAYCLRDHILTHGRDLDSEEATNRKAVLRLETEMNKCPNCFYRTRCTETLKWHIGALHGNILPNPANLNHLTHEDLSEVETCKCDECCFMSHYRYNSKMQMYKCEKCNFTSRYKHILRKHQLRHKDPSEVQMYKCDQCSYESRYKQTLKAHELRHKDPSQA